MNDRLIGLSNDIHGISRRLHPSILDDLGLIDSIASECQELSEREGIEILYSPENVSASLPREISLCLYRIVQESLRNIVKHSQAKRVRIALVGERNRIHLSIQDFGIGFDADGLKVKEGLGLASMKERVSLIEGELSIRSRMGHGTTIEVWAPLEAQEM